MHDQPPVASPCVSICVLDEGSICLGCGRLIGEIAEWSQAGEARRRDIVEAARRRKAILPPPPTGEKGA